MLIGRYEKIVNKAYHIQLRAITYQFVNQSFLLVTRMLTVRY